MNISSPRENAGRIRNISEDIIILGSDLRRDENYERRTFETSIINNSLEILSSKEEGISSEAQTFNEGVIEWIDNEENERNIYDFVETLESSTSAKDSSVPVSALDEYQTTTSIDIGSEENATLFQLNKSVQYNTSPTVILVNQFQTVITEEETVIAFHHNDSAIDQVEYSDYDTLLSETVANEANDESDLFFLNIDVDTEDYSLESTTTQIDLEFAIEEISSDFIKIKENDNDIHFESSTEMIEEKITKTFDSEDFPEIGLITSKEPISEGSGIFLDSNYLETENFIPIVEQIDELYFPETSSSETTHHHQTQMISGSTSDYSSKYVLQWVVISPSNVTECLVQFRQETLGSGEDSDWLYINAVLREDGPDTYIGKVTLEHLQPGSEYQVRILTTNDQDLDVKEAFFFTTKDDQFSGNFEDSSGSGYDSHELEDDVSGDSHETHDTAIYIIPATEYDSATTEYDSEFESSTIFEKKNISSSLQKNLNRNDEISDSLAKAPNIFLSLTCVVFAVL